MTILGTVIGIPLGLLASLWAVTLAGSAVIARRHPPAGTFRTVRGTRMHYVHVAPPDEAVLPPVVFIHGASGNLKDQMVPVRHLLEGKAEMLFPDRPGHGWSERGKGNETPDGQADTIAALMDDLGIARAVIVGHSFGGAVATAFALRHPERTAGLVPVSAASHPWPGGGTSWYYRLTVRPLLGPLFARTLALPAGLMRMDQSTRCVFAPNQRPETYVRDASISLVLRPANFRFNAIDVEGLFDHVAGAAPRYGEILAPTVVISGNRDTVVYEEVHSKGLERDIPGARLIWIDNLGHKPDFAAPDLVVAAIGHVSGAPESLTGNLDAVARQVEERLSGDEHGPPRKCREPEPPDPEWAPS